MIEQRAWRILKSSGSTKGELRCARDFIVSANAGIARKAASKVIRSHDIGVCSLEPDDVHVAAMVELCAVVDRYDPAHRSTAAFSTFAYRSVSLFLLNMLRDVHPVPRGLRERSMELDGAEVALRERLGRPAYDEEIVRELGWPLEKLDRMEIMRRAPMQISQVDYNGMRLDLEMAPCEMLSAGEMDVPDPLRHVLDKEREAVAMGALRLLTPVEQGVIDLVVLQEMECRIAARMLGLSLNTVYRRRRSGLNKLHMALSRDLGPKRTAHDIALSITRTALTPTQQRVIDLHTQRRLSVRDISTATGMKPSRVRDVIDRAGARLRRVAV